jgi:hypothetical protein
LTVWLGAIGARLVWLVRLLGKGKSAGGTELHGIVRNGLSAIGAYPHVIGRWNAIRLFICRDDVTTTDLMHRNTGYRRVHLLGAPDRIDDLA